MTRCEIYQTPKEVPICTDVSRAMAHSIGNPFTQDDYFSVDATVRKGGLKNTAAWEKQPILGE